MKYILIIYFVLLHGCSPRPTRNHGSESVDGGALKSNSILDNRANDTSNRIEGFSVYQAVAGIKDWELESREALVSDKDKKVYLDGIKLVFYEKGRASSNMTAKKGFLNTETNDIYGEGNCIVKTNRGDILETEQIYYKSVPNRIYSDADIKLTQEDGTITGKGLEATTDLESIIIKNQNIQTE